jgi:hypothetical protein
MAYSPPTTFANGTVLTSASLEGNFDALRVYLHGGIIASDLDSSPWIQTRHIQPPRYEPYTGVQHGVSGHQGGQWSGGASARLTFATKYTTGGGKPSTSTFERLSGTSFQVEIVQPNSIVLFHYWYEAEVGPDYSTGGGQVADATERLVWIGPLVGNTSLVERNRLQPAQNIQNGFQSSYPIGAAKTFPMSGGYASRSGTLSDFKPRGIYDYGLVYHSQVDRVAVINWSVALEVYYL